MTTSTNYPSNIDIFKTLVFRGKKSAKEYLKNRFGTCEMMWDEEYFTYYGNGLYAVYIEKVEYDFPEPIEEDDDDEKCLRQRENMADYIHSGAGLQAYYEDQEAGYVE